MSPMTKLPLAMEHALLGFLARRPMHAYEMHQTLMESRELGLIWHLKQSQLYALLTRLEDAGYVTTVTEPQGTRPPRKISRLTDARRFVAGSGPPSRMDVTSARSSWPSSISRRLTSPARSRRSPSSSGSPAGNGLPTLRRTLRGSRRTPMIGWFSSSGSARCRRS
jgi:hypothetical protein